MTTANAPHQPDATAIREALQALLTLIADAVAKRLASNNNQKSLVADEQVPPTTER